MPRIPKSLIVRNSNYEKKSCCECNNYITIGYNISCLKILVCKYCFFFIYILQKLCISHIIYYRQNFHKYVENWNHFLTYEFWWLLVKFYYPWVASSLSYMLFIRCSFIDFIKILQRSATTVLKSENLHNVINLHNII